MATRSSARWLALLLVVIGMIWLGVRLADGLPVFSEEPSLGCLPSPAADYPEARVIARGPLPRSVDLSASMPPVGNQGQSNTCVGWAVGYYLKGFQEGAERRWDLTARAHQFSPSFIYNQRTTSACAADRGMSLANALAILSRQGCATLDLFPYTTSNLCLQPTADQLAAAEAYRIAEYAVLFRGQGTANIAALKTYLASGQPIVAAIPVYASARNASPSAPPLDLPASGDTYLGGHAIVLVGYDDTYYGVGAFKFVNSWGVTWRLGGYGYLTYEFMRQKAWEAWTATDIVESLPELRGQAVELGGAPNDAWQAAVSDPSFDWGALAPAASGVRYRVYFGPDPAGVAETTVDAPRYDPPAVPSGSYYLRVAALTDSGQPGPWATLFILRYRPVGE